MIYALQGVLYTHRSNFLHAMILLSPDALALGASSTILMIVPMFHANSWGLNFAGPMVGARLVLPGPYLDGENICQLLDRFQVTVSAGVPTIWLNVLQHLSKHKLKLTHLQRVCIAGSAPPRAMIEALEGHNVDVRHLWGMTELSPMGSLGTLSSGQLTDVRSKADIITFKEGQGRPHLFCDMRIVDDEGRELPHDGKTVGHLQVHAHMRCVLWIRACVCFGIDDVCNVFDQDTTSTSCPMLAGQWTFCSGPFALAEVVLWHTQC
eukprot:GHRR01026115.1.p1 GENE.GHRR01026115.1~~GHRR01026115.1.p1  ORF type:complete len:265 (+),score=70.67 GHRR01026115.1:511-1305(+)